MKATSANRNYVVRPQPYRNKADGADAFGSVYFKKSSVKIWRLFNTWCPGVRLVPVTMRTDAFCRHLYHIGVTLRVRLYAHTPAGLSHKAGIRYHP
ncbi:hypothetical protein [Mucilaginibacter antarcticus]|uniref:Uncharacterized protein n=1 Tax=Mucilaginibacter antarcticus TaxID=1855725 RepID=A0ABW5XQW7_9SPHI